MREPLPAVQDQWHDRTVDVLSLKLEVTKKANGGQGVYRCEDPGYEMDAVAKFAHHPEGIHGIAQESAIYKKLRTTEIGPRFLAHLTESERIIGFLLEYIPHRNPAKGDWPKCKAAVDKLHAIGIKHGDLHKCNILVREHDAVLIDFSESTDVGVEIAKQESMGFLEQQLKWN